ncbi:MAG: hypothetical protein ACRD1G_09010, partial [Acidimicrobiales bacterium]
LALHHDVAVGRAASSFLLIVISGVAVLASAVAVVGALWSQQRQRPTLCGLGFGIAAGICYSVGTLATREIGLLLEKQSPLVLFSTSPCYILIVFSVLAITLLQRGYQSGAVIVAFPVTNALSSSLAVLAGILVLGEGVPRGFGLALLIVANILIVLGIVGLGRQPSVARMVSA